MTNMGTNLITFYHPGRLEFMGNFPYLNCVRMHVGHRLALVKRPQHLGSIILM